MAKEIQMDANAVVHIVLPLQSIMKEQIRDGRTWDSFHHVASKGLCDSADWKLALGAVDFWIQNSKTC